MVATQQLGWIDPPLELVAALESVPKLPLQVRWWGGQAEYRTNSIKACKPSQMEGRTGWTQTISAILVRTRQAQERVQTTGTTNRLKTETWQDQLWSRAQVNWCLKLHPRITSLTLQWTSRAVLVREMAPPPDLPEGWETPEQALKEEALRTRKEATHKVWESRRKRAKLESGNSQVKII